MISLKKLFPYVNFEEKSGHSETVRGGESLGHVEILPLVDEMQLQGELGPVYRVLRPPAVLPAPVEVELQQLVGGVQGQGALGEQGLVLIQGGWRQLLK